MKGEQALVPKLRFGEFAQGWATSKIGELCPCIVPGRNKPKTFEGEIPWITTPDITHQGVITQSKVKLGLSEGEAKSVGSKIVPKDSVIISCVGDLGLVAITGNKLVINQQLHAFLPCEELSPRFTLYGLSTQTKFMDKVATKTAVPYMNKDNCNSIPIHYPSLPEQEKIAAFLTSVDDRIDQLKCKKSLLQDYKKGAMQKLFSQELRFKDEHGNDYPDWEEKKLEDVYTYQTTNSYSRDKLNYESGEVYNIHYGDIHTKFRCHFHLSNEYVPYLNPDIETDKIKPECFLQIGDIVLADASEDYADIGKSIEVIDLDEAEVVAGLHTYILRPDTSKISKGFGAYLMQARPTRLEVMRIAQGTKVLGLPKAYLSFITLNIPHSEEQTKIANFLSSLDRKIEQVDTQITQTQTFKKGLLQQMFV